MKNLLLFIGFISLLTIGCKDACKDVTCLNNSICVDGACHCQEGYSGEDCSIASPCLNMNCLNGGECIDGTCDCPEGFEGIDCSETPATKFIGIYDVICNGSLDIDGNNQNFNDEPATATIYQGEDNDEIIMYVELEMITNSIPMVVDATAEVDELEYDMDASAESINVSVSGININLDFLIDATGTLNNDTLTSVVTFTGDLAGTINCVGIKQ